MDWARSAVEVAVVLWSIRSKSSSLTAQIPRPCPAQSSVSSPEPSATSRFSEWLGRRSSNISSKVLETSWNVATKLPGTSTLFSHVVQSRLALASAAEVGVGVGSQQGRVATEMRTTGEGARLCISMLRGLGVVVGGAKSSVVVGRGGRVDGKERL